jgi:plastocyanin
MFLTIISVTVIPFTFAEPHEITIKPIPNSGTRDVCGESLGVDCYTPNPITINVGDLLTFSNTDTEPHFFTSGQMSDNEIGIAFDSGLLAPNEIFTWNPDVIGNFSYFCPIHPWMQGIINVEQNTSEKKQEEIPKAPIADVEKVNSNSTELDMKITPDAKIIPNAVEIDPEPKFVDEKTITEMKICSPSTWECILTLFYLEFSNYLTSLIQNFI